MPSSFMAATICSTGRVEKMPSGPSGSMRLAGLDDAEVISLFMTRSIGWEPSWLARRRPTLSTATAGAQ